MKPPRERLELSTYAFKTELAPRFGDMDALHHLNNVALAGIYEEARLRFTLPFSFQASGARDGRSVLAEATIRYLAEGQYPGLLTIGVGVLRIGRASYVIGQGMFQNGRCIGTADVVVVWTSDGRPAPLPSHFRAALEAGLIPQPVVA